MSDCVLVDICIWASFFSKPNSPEKRAVDVLLDADRVALVGPIVTEVLLGFRRADQADWVASRLRLAHCPDIEWDDWQNASILGRSLMARGHKLPLTDLVVATVANRIDASVYTTDPHFDCVPSLERYVP